METQEISQVRDAYGKALARLLVLNLDCVGESAGTARHDLKELVTRIASDERNDVILLSARSREELQGIFSSLRLTLVAEDGGFSRSLDGTWMPSVKSSVIWREPVRKVLRALAQQYDGSFVEEKHFSVAWHYDAGHVHPSAEDKRQLFTGLRSLSKQFELTMRESPHVVEFGVAGVSKEKFITEWMTVHRHYDIILAIGDNTDERLFGLLTGFFTICVGYNGPTGARYEIRKKEDMLDVLNKLVSPANSAII